MIAKRIEDLRKLKKLTLKELSEELGITLSGLQKALKTDDFKVSQLNKIAEALGVDISYFFNHKLTEDGYLFLKLKKVNYDSTLQYENEQYIEAFYKICIKQVYDYFVIENGLLIYNLLKKHKSVINNKNLKNYIPYLNGAKNNIYDIGDINDLMAMIKIAIDEAKNDSSLLVSRYGIISDINRVMTKINKSFIKMLLSNEYVKWLIDDKLIEEEDYILLITSVTCKL